MDVGFIAPVVGVVLAAIVVLVLWRVMRMRASKSARPAAPALSESEAEFLDSSHIISGPITGAAADPRRNSADRKAPPPDRLP